MGFVVLGVYCAESLWQRLRGKPEPGERRLWLVTAVCVPAAFLNPNGFLTLYILLAYRQSSHDRLAVRMAEAGPVAAFVSQPAAARRGGGAGVAAPQDAPRRLDTARSSSARPTSPAIRNSNLLGLVAPVMLAAYLPWKRIAAVVDGVGRRRASASARSPSPSPAGAPSSCAMPSGNTPPVRPIFCWRTTSPSRCSTPTRKADTCCGAAGLRSAPSSMDAA